MLSILSFRGGVVRSTQPLLAVLLAAALAVPADALLINVTQVSNGDSFPIGIPPNPPPTAGPAPATITGSGSLLGVVNAAADYWEGIFTGPGTLNVSVGWRSLPPGNLGVATQFVTRNFGGAGKTGQIAFDNDSTAWFADGSPMVNSEYLTFTETNADLGGGTMTIGREFNGATGSAAGRFDLYTVAVHEIGHLLGMADFSGIMGVSDPPSDAFVDGDVDITSGPFVGAVIPLTMAGGGHLDPVTFLDAILIPTIAPGQRRLASDADIAGIAELSGFGSVNYAAAVAPIPEPTQLLAFGLLAMVGAIRPVRRRRKLA